MQDMLNTRRWKYDLAGEKQILFGMLAPVAAVILMFATHILPADAMPLAKQEPESSLIVERSPCARPFEDYGAWLNFMDQSADPDWRADTMRQLVDEAAFDRYHDNSVVRCDKISYLSDGLKVVGFIVEPSQHDNPLPVILFAHGGVAEWGRITFFDLLEMHRLAERGYIVIASALRGEGGSEGAPNLGAGDLADMLRLIDVAKEIDGADVSRIGLWGFSRGAGLGYRILAQTDRFKAAALIGAPSDLVNSDRRQEFDQYVYPGVVDDYEKDKDAALAALSATYWPERLSGNTNVLLIHGAADERVPVADSLTMAAHLARLNHPFRLVVPKNGSHTLIEHQAAVRNELDQWFDAYLKPSPLQRQ